jgi:hypothetical protein
VLCRATSQHDAVKPAVAGAVALSVVGVLLLAGASSTQAAEVADEDLVRWSERFSLEVDRTLDVPPIERQRYIALLQQAMVEASQPDSAAQAFVLADRSPLVLALFISARTPAGGWHWMGAAPASTGRPGGFDRFITPIGVFAHTLRNPDSRAEGSFNESRICGCGLRGMRLFDFGWVMAERGWGTGGISPMCLQMHVTDADRLEPRLGRAESKGCIRIPATLYAFLDRYGILDADYEQALDPSEARWVLRANCSPVAWPGRDLVIVDSQRFARTPWSPWPGSKQRQGVLQAAIEPHAAQQEFMRHAPRARSAC